ncbi:uncharacterized protein [Amphiura filiformis]|uniref:uncharacterized protein n=1 Tax=Amphiura filiformis TaxID=82378 RepID=UPI003B20C22F
MSCDHLVKLCLRSSQPVRQLHSSIRTCGFSNQDHCQFYRRKPLPLTRSFRQDSVQFSKFGLRWSTTAVSTMDSVARKKLLQHYEPPDWAGGLKIVPKYKVQLANTNTPIQRWYIPGIPDGFEVYIKRDDMLGSELSGNKVRKLEFLLADAIHQGYSSVITCGGIQSNHCRATALAARQLGLQPYLLLRSPPDPGNHVSVGNALLNRLIGSHLYLIPQKAQQATEIMPRMKQLSAKLKSEKEEDAYIVPIGGSSAIGLYGYLEGFNELMTQGVDQFSDIVLATGSGGSTAGLAIANHLTKSDIKIHGMMVCDGAKYFHDHINETLTEIGLTDRSGVKSEDIVDLVDGVKGEGYGISTQEELDFIASVALSTGILLDPVYTGKAALHLVKLLQQNPQRFQGKKILFIHTGGIFGLFDGRMDAVLNTSYTNSIHEWFQLNDEVPWLP